MSEGFMMTTDTGLLFFRVCSIYKINKLEQRIALLRKIVARNRAKYIRDPKEFVQDKKVLIVKPK